MINTELSLFVARTETELNHIHDKLRLLLILADENATEDCVDTAESMVNDVCETAKAAAMRIDSLGSKMWSLLYNLEKELADKKAAAMAEAAMKAATEPETANAADAVEGGELNG